MLAIRMQRTGRRGHAQYRLIAQDSRFTPTSGRVVAFLGSYDPHTKKAIVDGEKVTAYLANGAQPSDRAAKLLQKEGIKLPDWVKISQDKKREIRNPEKLRRNRPAEELKSEASVPEEALEVTAGEPTADEPKPEVEPVAEEPAEPAEKPAVVEPEAPEAKA